MRSSAAWCPSGSSRRRSQRSPIRVAAAAGCPRGPQSRARGHAWPWRGNTRGNIRSVQCVQCVQQTDQFGRFGRPWKHLRALYRVEGLVDFMIRGGSSPLGRTGRAPHRQSVLTGLWQTPCRVGSEQPRIVDRRRCGSGHRPRGCGRIRTVGIGRVGCDSATVFDIPEARQGGATRKLSPERDSTQLRIVPTGPTNP